MPAGAPTSPIGAGDYLFETEAQPIRNVVEPREDEVVHPVRSQR